MVLTSTRLVSLTMPRNCWKKISTSLELIWVRLTTTLVRLLTTREIWLLLSLIMTRVLPLMLRTHSTLWVKVLWLLRVAMWRALRTSLSKPRKSQRRILNLLSLLLMLTIIPMLTLMLSKSRSIPTTLSSGTLLTPTTTSSRVTIWVTRKNGDRLLDNMNWLTKTSQTISKVVWRPQT